MINCGKNISGEKFFKKNSSGEDEKMAEEEDPKVTWSH